MTKLYEQVCSSNVIKPFGSAPSHSLLEPTSMVQSPDTLITLEARLFAHVVVQVGQRLTGFVVTPR